jgi:CheY-like chemotaxis protein
VPLRPFGQPAERGYYGYVHKPIHPAQLLDCLERVIKGPIKMEKILQLKDADGGEAAGTRRALPILVVEDHPMNQPVIEEILRKLGYRFFTAVNGKQALQTLRENSFQLVLMDCQMPEMDGFEVTRRIRQGEAGELNSRLPIIALTAHALVGDRERCLKSGMDDYVAKPVHIADLAVVLKRWTHRPPQAPKAIVEAPAAATPLVADSEAPAELPVAKVEPVAPAPMILNVPGAVATHSRQPCVGEANQRMFPGAFAAANCGAQAERCRGRLRGISAPCAPFQRRRRATRR